MPRGKRGRRSCSSTRPSLATYARVGIVVAPLSILAALAALKLAGTWY